MENEILTTTLNSVRSIFSNIAFLDFFICFILTVPLFLTFLISSFIYFKKIDKSVDEKTHGLSRFSLGGVLVIFGLIILDMNVEFISAMFISLNAYGKLDLEELKPILSSIFFINFVDQYRKLPFDILVIGNIFCTALYAGAEGLISSFKTLKVPEGMCIELPYLKRKRIKFIFLIWSSIAILATIYTIIIGSEEIQFEVSLSYMGVISTLIILILADRTPSILQNFTSGKKNVTEVNLVSSVNNNNIDYDKNEKEYEDAIDHITDVGAKILKKLNPTIEDQSGGGDL